MRCLRANLNMKKKITRCPRANLNMKKKKDHEMSDSKSQQQQQKKDYKKHINIYIKPASGNVLNSTIKHLN